MLGAGQFAAQIGRMIKTRQQFPFNGRHVDLGRRMSFNNCRKDAVVLIVPDVQETPHPIDKDDKITCWIRDHLRWQRPANLPTATPKARAARGACQNAFPARIAQSVFKLN